MNYLIVGAGPAGIIAAETLRRTDPSGAVTVIGGEAEAPYSRMAIPYYLAEDVGEEGTHLRHGSGHFEGLGIAVRQGTVASVDPAAKSVTLSDGGALAYDRLLIATGSHTTRPPIPGMDLDGIENCWTLADARRIADQAKPGSKVVLMGAGFIGCIVLEALAARKVDLTVIEMADRMLARMMDETGGDMIKRWCESKGVKVLTGTQVTGIEQAGSGLKLSLGGGGSAEADLVVCATGVRPNIDFLQGSGVATDIGVLVNHKLGDQCGGHLCRGRRGTGPRFLDRSAGDPRDPADRQRARPHRRHEHGRAEHRFPRQPLDERALDPRPGLLLIRAVDGCRRRRPGGCL